ncbi:hypothetical protein ACFSJU_06755 [Paradesertivirga mongoliensis]|uniref:Lipoprotein n=1 Tax=Paradesertivirga mongoliensis TaxID=2100740 RepID=A0ABW4ZJ59_9SPHI|nr:hypothetical protein [Pedobacter mongoliensis]
MNAIQFLNVSFFWIIICSGCSNPTNNEIEELRKQTKDLQKQIDSLKNAASDTISAKPDTLVAEPPATKSQPPSQPDGQLRPGKHQFTLQWISWDEPGSVMIQPAEDGWFSIEGQQKSRKNNDYITIRGLIKQISASELQFRGEIKSVVETVNGGEPCVRTGTKIFKTTKNRKYWRLQDMINCEGGMLTDYVDIYFQ